MGRIANDQPGPFSLAVADTIRREMGSRRLSGRALATLIGKSEKYLRVRLADEIAFSLTDVEHIAGAMGMSPAELLRRADQERS